MAACLLACMRWAELGGAEQRRVERLAGTGGLLAAQGPAGIGPYTHVFVSANPPPLAGTEKGMEETFGSTCHGAGRACSRNNSRNNLQYQQVLDALKTKGISIRWVGRAGRAGWQQMHRQLPAQRVAQPTVWRPREMLRRQNLSLAHPALPPLFTRSLLAPFPSPRCRVASPKLVMEEAPESYKDVSEVVDTCHAAGISKKTVKLRPIAVIKG